MAGHETKFIDCSYIMSVCIVYVCLWGGAWVRGYVCGVLFIRVWVEGVILNLNF